MLCYTNGRQVREIKTGLFVDKYNEDWEGKVISTKHLPVAQQLIKDGIEFTIENGLIVTMIKE